ncbi:MAG TPA: hypothetical protein DEF45_03505 [Rhodopirellula sp.]|nr:hypothetical protein [Rhodopirellula sp.]
MVFSSASLPSDSERALIQCLIFCAKYRNHCNCVMLSEKIFVGVHCYETRILALGAGSLGFKVIHDIAMFF